MSEDSKELNNESISGITSSYIVSNSGSMVFDAARRRYAYRFVKRLFDIVFSLIVCVVLFVPVGILCLAIVFDSSGSPIFAQKRVGRYGKPIKVLKLRTMFSDAHSCPEKYFTDDQMRQWRQEYKVEDDPRITRIGSFLRKTSLDELPQFLNVLKGDIPLRILKTHPWSSLRNPWVRSRFPPNLARTKERRFRRS